MCTAARGDMMYATGDAYVAPAMVIGVSMCAVPDVGGVDGFEQKDSDDSGVCCRGSVFAQGRSWKDISFAFESCISTELYEVSDNSNSGVVIAAESRADSTGLRGDTGTSLQVGAGIELASAPSFSCVDIGEEVKLSACSRD